MLLKLTSKHGKTILVNTDTVTEIHVYKYGEELVTAIVFLNETASEVEETVEEIYNQWLSAWRV